MGEAGAKGTMATSVYALLRADLLSGRLAPDSKVRVDWVVARYGAGASPVREALNRLAAEGLLNRRDQRGFSVVPVSAADLEELTRTRCLIEEVALREAIANRSDGWEEGIVLALHRLSRVPRQLAGEPAGPNPEWESAHRRFHGALIAACNSRWLIGFCEQLADQAYRYRQIARHTPGGARDPADEHRALAELAVAGEADGAADALKRHFRLTSALCLEGLPDGATPGTKRRLGQNIDILLT